MRQNRSSSGSLDLAYARWAELLGTERITRDPEILHAYQRTTIASGPPPAAVLRPSGRDDVVALVRVAVEHGVPLYPISKGKNWGLGSACPPTEGQVIVDLGAMNRILEVNEELAYAVIEPGVTQAQLADYLTEHEIPLMIDCTGGGREASLLGNCLERGDGFSPYGDRFLHCAGMEVVLADGTVVDTGFGHFPNPWLGPLYKWGVGPSLDGLFSQSNMGIVTRLSFWLQPEPEHVAGLLLVVEDDAKYEDLVDCLRPLRLDGTIQVPIHLFNDLRVLSSRMRYPYARTGGVTPLPRELRAQLRRETKVGAWNAWGGIYGTRAQVAAHWKAIKAAVKGTATAQLVTIDRLLWAGRAFRTLRKLRLPFGRALEDGIESLRAGFGTILGLPTDATLVGPWWRKRDDPHPTSLDPLDNDVGMYWFTPVCPCLGREARQLVELAEAVFARFGFEPHLTCTLLNGRALLVATTLYYDRADPDQRSRAQACHDAYLEETFTRGFYHFRMGIGGMRHLDPEGSSYWQLVRKLKDAVDPQGILAPGRYAPWQLARARSAAGSSE